MGGQLKWLQLRIAKVLDLKLKRMNLDKLVDPLPRTYSYMQLRGVIEWLSD